LRAEAPNAPKRFAVSRSEGRDWSQRRRPGRGPHPGRRRRRQTAAGTGPISLGERETGTCSRRAIPVGRNREVQLAVDRSAHQLATVSGRYDLAQVSTYRPGRDHIWSRECECHHRRLGCFNCCAGRRMLQSKQRLPSAPSGCWLAQDVGGASPCTGRPAHTFSTHAIQMITNEVRRHLCRWLSGLGISEDDPAPGPCGSGSENVDVPSSGA
jgi:hypothetical protein